MSLQPTPVAKASGASSKSTSSPGQNAPSTPSNQQSFSADSRRSGSLGSHGSSSSSRHSHNTPTPRNNQITKPKHKTHKRSRLIPDEDADAELASMQNLHGRRGQQSITHLMQFALPPRPSQGNGYGRGLGSGSQRRRTWGLGSGYHAVDKAKYIHANYRFVVSPQGDYHAQTRDADVHLDWSNVLQVIGSAKTQASSCPICLGEPTAPRMAKCGHIFCLPCLIRYMHSEDATAASGSSMTEKKPRWKKCPICWDSIYISETRPVRWYTGAENDPPTEGGDVVLRLVKRRPDSTLAMPRDSDDPLVGGDDIPWHFAAEVMDYARVMKGSEEYMISQYDEALAAVELLEKEDELMFGEDTEWTGRAMRMLKEAKEKLRGIGNPPEQPKKPSQAVSMPERLPDGMKNGAQTTPDTPDHLPSRPPQPESSAVREAYVTPESNVPPVEEPSNASSANTASITPANAHSDVPRTLTELRQRHTEVVQPVEYLFYHALQHFYLSPLDIRILKTAFGSYTAFPSSILPRVERVSSGHIVDDDLRKRVKYLAHLPHGCEVGFLECDWTDTVPATILAEYLPQIQKRRARNEEKEAREEKERARIQRDEEKEYAALRRTKRAGPPTDAFSYDLDQLPILSGSVTDGSAPFATSPPWPQRSTAGFASLASPSTSPSAPRTVWGTAAVVPTSPDVNAASSRDADFSDDREDGWLPGWEHDLLAETELAEQVENVDIGSSSAKPGGKKGKKGKKITLMSTTTTRRGA